MREANWVVTYGSAKVSDGEITHVPVYVEEVAEPVGESGRRAAPHSLLRSDIWFEQGTVSWEVKLDAADGRCQVLLPADIPASGSGGSTARESFGAVAQDLDLAAGVNVLDTPYGFGILRSFNWEPGGGVGTGTLPEAKKWIKVAVQVSGSLIELFINGVKVIATTRTLRYGQIGLFMQGNQAVRVRNLHATTADRLCFVVMQFTPEFDVLFRDVIKPVCETYGYRVIRGDDFYTSGLIIEDVTQSIRAATLIIADITPDNANVFYEVGYAHAIGKPTILLSDRKREKLPFDVAGLRTLFYENSIGGKALVEERLKQHLDALRVG